MKFIQFALLLPALADIATSKRLGHTHAARRALTQQQTTKADGGLRILAPDTKEMKLEKATKSKDVDEDTVEEEDKEEEEEEEEEGEEEEEELSMPTEKTIKSLQKTPKSAPETDVVAEARGIVVPPAAESVSEDEATIETPKSAPTADEVTEEDESMESTDAEEEEEEKMPKASKAPKSESMDEEEEHGFVAEARSVAPPAADSVSEDENEVTVESPMTHKSAPTDLEADEVMEEETMESTSEDEAETALNKADEVETPKTPKSESMDDPATVATPSVETEDSMESTDEP